jgi:hypothetical protein
MTDEKRARIERFLPLLFLVFAFLSVAPVFAHPFAFAAQYDWRYFQSWIEVGRRSLVWFHQVPLWNPYGCGGEVLLANPQSEVAAPTFLLPVLFGTALGVKLALVFYVFCAFDGMYRLARDQGLSLPASLFASVLFGTSGWLALHVSSGHSNFASAGMFPYLVLFYRRANRDLVWTLPLGATAAWIIGLGGTSTPAMATVLLVAVAAIDAVKLRSARPFVSLAAGAACAALLGAARLLPTLEFAIDHPRHQWETDRSTVLEMIRNAYWWRGLEPVAGKRYWFHEYGYKLAYVTPPFIALSLWSKRTRAWWVVVVVAGAIVAGSAIPFGPWWLLKHLPIYRDLRVPSRYALLLAFALSLLAAGGLDELRAWLAERGRARLATTLSLVVVALALVDGLLYDMARYKRVFEWEIEPAGRDARFFQVHGDWRTMMNHVLAGQGAIGCDEEAPLQRAERLDEGDLPQVRLADPGAGTITDVDFSPNRVTVGLTLLRPTVLLLNENWNEHWKARTGSGARLEVLKVGPKYAHDRNGGRLGVSVPAGEVRVIAYYRPTSFVVGALVSGLSVPLALALWLWRRRSLRAREN